MKKLLLIAGLLSAFVANAQTNFSGQVTTNTTWTKAQSPYIVTGPVLVDSGVTLTIEPGVTVKVPMNNPFYVDGTIKAVGTPTDSIYFVSTLTGTTAWDAWLGFEFRPLSADTNIFRYCHFRNAQHGINMYNLEMNIADCAFSRCRTAVICYQSDIYPVIKNNYFDDCIHAIIVHSNTGAEITNNKLSYCASGIDARGFNDASFRISNNVVDHSHWFGIRFTGGFLEELNNNTVSNTDLYSAIDISHVTLSSPVQGNVIHHNKTGMGLVDVKGSIVHNTIFGNWEGLYCENVKNADLTFENNCLDSNWGNIVTVGKIGAGAGNDSFYLEPNWYGDVDSSAINAKMHDYYDDFTSGFVFFYPYLTQKDALCKSATPTPTPTPTHVANAEMRKQAISVYPNPFNTCFTLKLDGAHVKEVAVYNVVGKKVAAVVPNGKMELTIDLSQHPTGMYIYQGVYDDNTSFSGKLVKE